MMMLRTRTRTATTITTMPRPAGAAEGAAPPAAAGAPARRRPRRSRSSWRRPEGGRRQLSRRRTVAGAGSRGRLPAGLPAVHLSHPGPVLGLGPDELSAPVVVEHAGRRDGAVADQDEAVHVPDDLAALPRRVRAERRDEHVPSPGRLGERLADYSSPSQYPSGSRRPITPSPGNATLRERGYQMVSWRSRLP